MAKKLDITGKVSISSYGNQVTFYFDKLDPKGPSEKAPAGVIEYSSNLGLEIWQKFGTKPVKITIEESDLAQN